MWSCVSSEQLRLLKLLLHEMVESAEGLAHQQPYYQTNHREYQQQRELLDKRCSQELEQLMEPRLYIGRCPQQVRKFLDACTPLLRQAQAADGDIRI